MLCKIENIHKLHNNWLPFRIQ